MKNIIIKSGERLFRRKITLMFSVISLTIFVCTSSQAIINAFPSDSMVQETKQKKTKGKKDNGEGHIVATLPEYKDVVFMYEDGKRLTPKEVEKIPMTKVRGITMLKEVAAEVLMTDEEKKAGKKRVFKILLKE